MELLRELTVFMAIYPWIYNLGLYISWGIAWLELGARPRPGLDDPQYLRTLDLPREIMNWLGQLMLVAFAVLILSLVIQGTLLIWQKRSLRLYKKLWIMATSLWLSAILFLLWDPLKVWYWFLD
jgi:hypothetical protein